MTTAEKKISVGSSLKFVPDNVAKMAALKKIDDIYGDNAPKHIDLTSPYNDMSDEELMQELEDSVKRFEKIGIRGNCSGEMGG